VQPAFRSLESQVAVSVTDDSHAHDYPHIIDNSPSTVRYASDRKDDSRVVEKHYREIRGLAELLIEAFAKVARVCGLRFPPCYLVPLRGSVLCRGAYARLYASVCMCVCVCVCVRASLVARTRPMKARADSPYFFRSLRIKEGRTVTRERESHCFIFFSRRSGICQYFPRDSPIYPSPAASYQNALSLAKSSKCVYYFSPLLLVPHPRRASLRRVFCFSFQSLRLQIRGGR